jgi:quercetin dioxygenase-like cupin family protein
MFISIMPPGQGPCLHSHNTTLETFMVLEGTIEYFVGEPVEHHVTLNKWDTFSCPPGVYRGFRNVGESDAVQLTVLTGLGENRDDVSMPDSVAQEVVRDHGEKVVEAFRSVFSFDPPPL